MKSSEKSGKSIKNFDTLVSMLNEKDILCLQAMSCVRGGEGEGQGGEVIIIIPPPTKPV
jgi:hypothetical protein